MVSPKTKFLEWDPTASNNTDIAGIGILGTNAVNNFDDALRTVMAQLRSGVDGEVVYAAKSGNYTAVADDNNAWHRYTATATVTLTAAATLGANWHYFVQADGAAVTIDPNGAETINGAATLVIQNGQTASIICTGTAFIAVVGGAPLSGPAHQGFIFGLTLSNNGSDATNDIDIAAGSAAAETSPYYVMTLASALTKRLDAAWAVGSGNGGLDTGSIANTTYHIWLIQRSDTGVVDALFSASATSPTMPTNYDRKRRIGSIRRESAAIVAFTQVGDLFKRAVVADRDSPSTTAGALLTLSVPSGIVCQPLLTVSIAVGSNSSATIGLADGSASSTGAVVRAVSGTAAGDVGSATNWIAGGFYTDTSSRVFFSQLAGAGTITNGQVFTYGWIDTRGKLA